MPLNTYEDIVTIQMTDFGMTIASIVAPCATCVERIYSPGRTIQTCWKYPDGISTEIMTREKTCRTIVSKRGSTLSRDPVSINAARVLSGQFVRPFLGKTLFELGDNSDDK